MHFLRFRFSARVAVACGLACGWLTVAVAANSADGFTLFLPSGAEQRLLVVRAQPPHDEVTLDMVRTLDLGFPGSTITADAKRPLLYVSGGQGKDGHNAAVVPLDAAGLPQAAQPVSLDRTYSYLSTDSAGRFLLGCHHMSGAVDVFPLDADGLPGKRVHGRDEGRHYAHCVLPSPDNRFVYIPYVKDNNALCQYGFDPATGALTPLDPLDVGPPEGSGPRHLVYHPRLPLVYFSEEQGLGVSIYGRFLAVTGFESATLMLYAIAADGGLTRAATLPIDKGVTDIVFR